LGVSGSNFFWIASRLALTGSSTSCYQVRLSSKEHDEAGRVQGKRASSSGG
jgi:hypothetical protein